jgi:hypothetical protein
MQVALSFEFKDEAFDAVGDHTTLHIERAVARMMAARLLEQPLQVTRGRSEFYDAL